MILTDSKLISFSFLNLYSWMEVTYESIEISKFGGIASSSNRSKRNVSGIIWLLQKLL